MLTTSLNLFCGSRLEDDAEDEEEEEDDDDDDADEQTDEADADGDDSSCSALVPLVAAGVRAAISSCILLELLLLEWLDWHY